MRSPAETIILIVEVYLALGALTAAGFLTVGVSRAMPHAGHITLAARLLILPASILLWPLVLRRWLAAR